LPESILKHESRSIWLLLLGFCAAAALVLSLCADASARLPDNLGVELAGEEREAVIARNSPMTDYVRLSPNADFPRGGTVQKITIHHMAGNLELEALGGFFSQRDRRSSANYGIDSTGRVALYVEEANRAWATSSRANDAQAVVIEVANDETGGDWHVSDEAYESLIALCVDICRRNGIPELRFTGDADGSLTIHKMFAETECPGPYLESRMEEIAQTVTARLRAGSSENAQGDIPLYSIPDGMEYNKSFQTETAQPSDKI